MSDQTPHPTPDGYDSWPAYWTAQGMPWRTEPEIDEARQRFLAERRAVKPHIEQGIYPFKDITLTRADVEWVLATHESGGMRGPVDWSDEKQRVCDGLDLRGADLRGARLFGLPLACTHGGLTRQERARRTKHQREAAATHMEDAIMEAVHLEGSYLSGVHLEQADLYGAHLERAYLRAANLQGTDLGHVSVQGADLRRAALDGTTLVSVLTLGDDENGYCSLADIRWGGVNLAVVNWQQARMLGDEEEALQKKDNEGFPKGRNRRLQEYEAAVRAYRQLATVLRDQGLNEDSDRFAYRAQFLQRQVLRRQGQWLRYFGSLLLDIIAGYGYRSLRSFATYLLVVGAFALVYLALGGAHGQPLSWNEAMVVSLTAFHGRGFFATAFQPGDPQAAVAAVEAVIGLLIEITFIATFTQRFFAR